MHQSSKCSETFCDIIGDPMLHPMPLSVGHVLPLLDMVTGCCARKYTGSRVVTGCFDHVALLSPLYHGDIITATATIIHSGTASVLMKVVAFHDTHPSISKSPIIRSFVTFVAVDTSDKPHHFQSKFPLPTSAVQQSHNNPSPHIFRTNRQLLSTSSLTTLSTLRTLAEAHLDTSRLQSSSPCTRTICAKDASINLRRYFLPRNLNHSGVVFGGDILVHLERAAVAAMSRICTGVFRTICIRSLSFLKPLPSRAALSISATMVACSERIACVMVRTFAEEGVVLDNTVLKPCHVGVFYLLRLDGERLGVCVNGGLEKEDLGMEFYRGVALVPHMDTFAVWGIEDDAFLSQERDDGRRNVVS